MLEALGAILLWSTLAALGLALRGVPPFLLVGVALLLGSVFGLRGLRPGAVRPALLALGVYGLFAYHLCLFLALRLAPPVEANLLNYLWPLLIVALSPLFVPGTRWTARHLLGALLGFAGAALLVTRGHAGFGRGAVAGYGLALAAAVIWSTYSLLARRAGHLPASTISAFCLASGALALACHLLLEPRAALPAGAWPWLLAVGLGPMGAAFYLWDRALKKLDPRALGTLAYLTPLLSTALLAVVSGERPGVATALAAALVVGGAAVGTWPVRPASRAGPPQRA